MCLYIESSGGAPPCYRTNIYSWRRARRSIERVRCEERALGRKSLLLLYVSGSWEGERGHGGAPGCVAAVWCWGWLTDGSATEWYGNCSERQACFSKKASRADIHHLVLLFLHPQRGSLFPARSAGWNVGIVCFCKSTGVLKVKWHSCDGVGKWWLSRFGEEGLDFGERVWELFIAARHRDVFRQLKCVFAAVFLATKSILSKLSEHLLSSPTTTAAIFSKTSQAVEILRDRLTSLTLGHSAAVFSRQKRIFSKHLDIF